jgi:hypothetical protein
MFDNSLPNSLRGDLMKETHPLYSVVNICIFYRKKLLLLRSVSPKAIGLSTKDTPVRSILEEVRVRLSDSAEIVNIRSLG